MDILSKKNSHAIRLKIAIAIMVIISAIATFQGINILELIKFRILNFSNHTNFKMLSRYNTGNTLTAQAKIQATNLWELREELSRYEKIYAQISIGTKAKAQINMICIIIVIILFFVSKYFVSSESDTFFISFFESKTHK